MTSRRSTIPKDSADRLQWRLAGCLGASRDRRFIRAAGHRLCMRDGQRVGGTRIEIDKQRAVRAAAAIIFFAYIGFDAVSTAAEEARNPRRDVPMGILGSLAVCTVLYISVAAVLTGLVPVDKIDIHAPVAEALSLVGFKWGAAIVAIGAVAGITSVLVVMMLGQIRVFFAMSRDQLLSPGLSKVHPRFGTPHRVTILTGLVVAILAALFQIGEAADMTNIGTFFAFVLVSFGVMLLRYTKPEIPRPFRLPLMPLVPILSIAACLYLMVGLPQATWIRFGVWTVLGIVVYAFYGMRYSKLAVQAPKQ